MLAQRMVHFAVNRPRAVTALMLGTTLLLLMAAALPTVAPESIRLVDGAESDPEDELNRLARFIVAPGLLDVLGAKLYSMAPESPASALVLSLELLPETLHA